MNVLNGVNLVGVFAVLCVMTLTEFDVINRQAPPWLQWTRRSSFGVMFMLLCNAIIEDNSRNSLLPLVWSGILALGINMIALIKRRPPRKNGKTYSSSMSVAKPQRHRRISAE